MDASHPFPDKPAGFFLFSVGAGTLRWPVRSAFVYIAVFYVRFYENAGMVFHIFYYMV